MDSEPPYLLPAPLPAWLRQSLCLASICLQLDFLSQTLSRFPSLLTAFFIPRSPEWGEGRSWECLAVMETGSPRGPPPVPESFLIVSLVTPEDNYLKDQS